MLTLHRLDVVFCFFSLLVILLFHIRLRTTALGTTFPTAFEVRQHCFIIYPLSGLLAYTPCDPTPCDPL